ncbi:glycosyltransferase 1 domain-containing protein 1 isoform X7 [Girardinichthys multiradiatus]|uniref:glycosyltransferase 1 domain-containing protein 1 isoform X7 n=1 Tax=Girardinichthys multiradiatus TaxID=208333 RepID=UPI001FABA1D1|nr:glycosyltransferase 1 domain-containing protein 1 isoform X7 [Girardinichthys multiradiatus]
MKLLFLACLSPKTGNYTTAERIRSHIESAGHTCELRDVADFLSPSDVAHLVSQNPPFQGALAIHLFKAGRLLLDIQLPFGVIFGGTDINEDVKDEQKRVVMEQVLLKARFAVAFTEKLKEEAEFVLVSPQSKIYVQPQGIQTEVAEKFCWTEFLMSSEWHSENHLNILIIIGPKYIIFKHLFICSDSGARQKVDPALTAKVEAVVKRATGVFLAQERSQRKLHAVMKRCFAVVNSSESEGMSAAILEVNICKAMDLRVPVLARNIPGNAAVVKHGVNGLLFSSPQEFVHQSQRLLSDHKLRERVVRNGKLYVEENHSVKQEKETYQRLVDTLHKAQFSA